MKRHFVIGGIALLLAGALGSLGERPPFFATWLAAWCFCAGLMLGTAAIGCIHRLTGGRWGQVLRPAGMALRRRMPLLLLLFLPVLAGMRQLYPWWPQTPGRIWFAHPFVALRFAGYAIGAWAFARADEPSTAGQAALRLIGWMLLGSLAAVDLLMSLTEGWTSSIFGWLTLTAQMTTGATAAVAVTTLKAAGSQAPRRDPAWRDLGNLMLMFVMLQAYLQFMQFLIIWAENLPREISWYLPRLDGGWRFVGLALIVLQFAAPLLALLFRRIKDDPQRLGRVALSLLAMQALASLWTVLPSVQAEGYAAWWLAPLVFGGMGMLLFGHMLPPPRRSSIAELSHG